jgi:hypothetical protein
MTENRSTRPGQRPGSFTLNRGTLLAVPKRYVGLDPAFVETISGRDWINHRASLRVVPDMNKEVP